MNEQIDYLMIGTIRRAQSHGLFLSEGDERLIFAYTRNLDYAHIGPTVDPYDRTGIVKAVREMHAEAEALLNPMLGDPRLDDWDLT